MAMSKQDAHEMSRSDEAKALAEEARQAEKAGDKDEAEFLADAARELDKAAADEVVGKG